MKNSKYADEKQAEVHKNFPQNHFLASADHCDKMYLWATFYRRNLDLFVKDYLGIGIHEYQAYWLYQMGVNTNNVTIGGRATAKSFDIALYAVSQCILRPRTNVVLSSAIKGQAALIITEKIDSELRSLSPNLNREIEDTKLIDGKLVMTFRNKSKIKVVIATDRSRGERSNICVREEYRQITKSVEDKVLSPFQIVRNAPYMTLDYYKNMEILKEEPVNIYISSSWIDNGHWMWQIVDQAFDEMLNGKNSCLLAFDEALTLKHGIRTRNQLEKEKRKLDDLSWRIEYLNERVKDNTDSFFSYGLLQSAQKNKMPWFPPFDNEDYVKYRKEHSIPKQNGEIRIVGCDMAFITNNKNDNSIFACCRLLPEKNKNGIVSYRMIVPHITSMQGGETLEQSLRIRRLFEDFEADYLVLDTRNGGIAILDNLARVLYDEERMTEYVPLSCMNNPSLAARGCAEGAKPCVYAVNASLKLNSDIAINFRKMLTDGQIELLVPFKEAQETILPKIKEYKDSVGLDEQLHYEKPFLETQSLVSEASELVYETKEQTGLIMIKEQGAKRKDRYTAVSYAAYFTKQLERDGYAVQDEYEFGVFIN